jgi:Ca2+-binding RTX toxin-like protein
MRRTAAIIAALITATSAVWAGSATATTPLEPIEGTQHADRIGGTRFDDTIIGRAGGDEINARRGDDSVKGGRGDDSLYGRRGDDILHDRRGDNALYGGKGRDVLVGSLDRRKDRYVCGPGWDVLVYSGRADVIERDRVVGCENVVTTLDRA